MILPAIAGLDKAADITTQDLQATHKLCRSSASPVPLPMCGRPDRACGVTKHLAKWGLVAQFWANMVLSAWRAQTRCAMGLIRHLRPKSHTLSGIPRSPSNLSIKTHPASFAVSTHPASLSNSAASRGWLLFAVGKNPKHVRPVGQSSRLGGPP